MCNNINEFEINNFNEFEISELGSRSQHSEKKVSLKYKQSYYCEEWMVYEKKKIGLKTPKKDLK